MIGFRILGVNGCYCVHAMAGGIGLQPTTTPPPGAGPPNTDLAYGGVIDDDGNSWAVVQTADGTILYTPDDAVQVLADGTKVVTLADGSVVPVAQDPSVATAVKAVSKYHGQPLTAQELQDILPQLDAAVGKSAACVIGNWMGGAPPASLLDQIKQQDTGWFTKNSLVGYVAAYFGKQVGGGYIPTIEDACPGGPSIDAALAKLQAASPDLYAQAMGQGTQHRTVLAKAAAKDIGQAAAKIYQAPTKFLTQVVYAAGDILEGAGQAVGFIGFLSRNIVPIAATAGVGYIAWKLWLRKAVSA